MTDLRRPVMLAAIQVACPACDAAPHVECVTASGRPASIHRKRMAARVAENERRLAEFLDRLDRDAFIRVVADADHDPMCSRRVGIGECACLCVVARSLLSSNSDTRRVA